MRLVALGLRNAEIARKLFISEQTVKSHLSNIFQKLEIQDRVVATASEIDREPPHLAQGAAKLPRISDLAQPPPSARHHDFAQRGVPPDNVCGLLFNEPVQARIRVPPVEGGCHGKGVDHIAEGARLDEQDPPGPVKPKER